MKRKISIFSKINLILSNQRGNFMGAGDGGDGGGNDPDQGSGDDPGAGGPQWQYPEGFDETLKGNATLMKYADKEKGTFNQANIMKALVHATGMLGKDKVTLPDETWTDDQYKDLYHKLGKPEDISEYSLKDDELPEGLEKNEKFHAKFKEVAFNANLLPNQAQAVYNSVNEFIAESIKEVNEAADAEHNSQVESLKKEWGDAFDSNCTKAFSALEQFASEKEIAQLKEQGFLESPIMTRLFSKVAQGMSEDNFNNKAKGTFGLTPDEANEEIQKMYTAGHPFMNARHPEHQHYKEKMLKLQRLKLKGKR